MFWPLLLLWLHTEARTDVNGEFWRLPNHSIIYSPQYFVSIPQYWNSMLYVKINKDISPSPCLSHDKWFFYFLITMGFSVTYFLAAVEYECVNNHKNLKVLPTTFLNHYKSRFKVELVKYLSSCGYTYGL